MLIFPAGTESRKKSAGRQRPRLVHARSPDLMLRLKARP